LHLVEREINGEIIFIDSKNRMKANRKEPQKLLQLWKELEQSTQVDLDESVFRHLQKYPYNGGILMKKEITSGPQHSVQGFFILYFFDEQLLTPIASNGRKFNGSNSTLDFKRRCYCADRA